MEKVYQNNQHYLSDFKRRLTLISDTSWVMIDHNEKKMVYGKLGSIPEQQVSIESMMDSSLFENNHFSVVNESKNETTYRFNKGVQQYGPYKAIDYIITKDGLLSGLNYHYIDENGYPDLMELRFSEINLNPKYEENYFSERRFVAENNGKRIPLNPYEQYQIVDLTKEEFNR